jgi:hypothetical protein
MSLRELEGEDALDLAVPGLEGVAMALRCREARDLDAEPLLRGRPGCPGDLEEERLELAESAGPFPGVVSTAAATTEPAAAEPKRTSPGASGSARASASRSRSSGCIGVSGGGRA